uniref:Uncharacterized protein n=1 Tax=Macrostomum lignano TaxID=282301 RepID=A0A1I8HK74_9PLAT
MAVPAAARGRVWPPAASAVTTIGVGSRRHRRRIVLV